MNVDGATLEAFAKAQRALAHRRSSSRLFTVVLLAVFFIALMTGLAAGASVYSAAAGAQMETNAARMETGLLASIIRANDAADSVGEEAGPEGKALVLTERLQSGTYELRIYKYQGAVVQEYSIAGTPITPSRAEELVESDAFDFSIDGSLVTVTTDQGSIDVAMRSVQGGA